MARIRLAGLLLVGLSASAAAQEPVRADEAQKTPETRGVFAWDDHPSLRLGEQTFIEFKARVQAHFRKSDAAIDDPPIDDLARRRVGVQGRVAGLVDFEIDRELAADVEPWRDVYANYRQFESIRVKGGQFKLPFSLDQNTSATDLDFIFRSRIATDLAPGRDIGVMVHGRLARGRLRYEVGSFAHDGRNARTPNPDRVFGGRTWAGRVVLQPFRSTQRRGGELQVGAALTSSAVPEGFAALRGHTALDASFFESDYWVRGERRRVGLELQWRPGPIGIQGEYIRTTTQRRGQSVEDTDLSPLVASGWYASATWLATGERKSRGADRPRRSIFRGGVGAIELAMRLEALGFASSARDEPASSSPRAEVVIGNANRAVTFGVNWHPCRWVKVQANLIHESLTDPAQGPLSDRRGFWSRVLRLQLAI